MQMRTYARRVTSLGKLMAPGPHNPVYLLMFVTNRCTAACDHCFYWRELNKNVKEELTLEEYEKVARSLGPMFQVTFTGGSPELRTDLPQIVEQFYRYCSPSQMTFCMLGNATDRIVTQAEAMLKNCPGQRFNIAISLDGLGEEHDRLRQVPGLFDRVIATVRRLGDLKRHWSNLRVGIGITVHGLNYKSAERTSSWVRENLPVNMLKPILVRGNPMNPETLNDMCKTTYLKVVDHDRNWVNGNRGGIFSPMDFVVCAKEAMQRTIIGSISHGKRQELKCGGARETAVIYPNGQVAGCELRDDILGNVRNVNYQFSRIWFNDRAKAFRRTAGRVSECQGCYHHCFLAPAMFRTPELWPMLLKTAWQIHRHSGN